MTSKDKLKWKLFEYTIVMPFATNRIQANHMDIYNNEVLKFFLVDESGISDLVACFKGWESVTRKEIKDETDGRAIRSRRGHGSARSRATGPGKENG